jgi:hypothetical protein
LLAMHGDLKFFKVLEVVYVCGFSHSYHFSFIGHRLRRNRYQLHRFQQGLSKLFIDIKLDFDIDFSLSALNVGSIFRRNRDI